MNDLRTAAQQALEALEWHYRQGHSNTIGGFRLKIDEKALRELRAALAQQAEPVQEPAHAHTTTLRALLECCLSWEPDACVLGNVMARDAAAALRYALAQPEGGGNLPPPWRCACGANLYIDEYGHPASRAAPRYGKPQQAEPVERAMQDAVTTGMGIMRGGERIDPGTIYKPIEGVPV